MNAKITDLEPITGCIAIRISIGDNFTDVCKSTLKEILNHFESELDNKNELLSGKPKEQ